MPAEKSNTTWEPKTPLNLHHLKGKEAESRYSLSPQNRDLFRQRTPIISEGNVKEKMEEIRHYVHNTMELYEYIFDSIKFEEGMYVQPVHKLRHPMIFYYGHTSSFYINKLCVAGLLSHLDHKKEEMFAIGVDEMSWDDLNEGHYNWPTAADVCAYRLKVRDTIDEMMTSGKYPLRLPLTFDNSTENDANAFWWIMLMGAEHERIHIETASVHLRELPMSYIRAEMSAFWKRCPHSSASSPKNELVPIAKGEVRLGRPFDDEVYGWDSDYSSTASTLVPVAPFKASKYLVSNAEFMAFIEDGGYENKALWDEEGWRWVTWRKPKHPWFWVADPTRPHKYALRLQTELIDLPLDWPCELNNLEAHAFCQYLSKKQQTPVRMLTEEEWLLLFDRYVKLDQHRWGTKAPGNVNFEQYCSSCPVNEFQQGDLYDVVGNVWQHTEEKVYPYAGYHEHPFYDDFSRPTFDGLHACMKGGAWVSSGNEASRDARFAFRRHFFQFIGLRYVVGEPVKPREVTKMAGVDADVDCITDCHFRESCKGIPNGPLRIAQHALALFKEFGTAPPHRALDLFCGAGRVSYELSAGFQEVIGVDFSARRLIPAFSLRERGECEYLTDRGTPQAALHKVKSDAYPWGSARDHVTFFQSDPVNLHAHLDHFSLIVCWNCLEHSYQPSAVPAHLLSRLVPGGILLLGTDGCFKERSSEHKLSYTSDRLVVEEDKKVPPHDTIYELLGGEKTVDRLGNLERIQVVFLSAKEGEKVREVQFMAYRKK